MLRFRNFLAAATLVLGFSSGLHAEEERRARRLESITWNPIDHKLTWVVSDGSLNGKGKFEGAKKFTYEIDMDQATMNTEGEDRRFSKQEAVSVHRLMDLVAKYAAESTVWWENGQGEPVDKSNSQQLHRDSPKHDDQLNEPQRPRRKDSDKAKIIRISVENLK